MKDVKSDFLQKKPAHKMLLKFTTGHFKRIFLSGYYRVFHGFGQAEFADGGSILGSSQLSSSKNDIQSI